MSSNTNFVQLKLALAATAAQTTLTVMVPSAPFQLPAINGTLTLLDVPAAPTKAEIIGYTTVTNNGDGTATLGGVTRGKEGTTAQAWAANSFLFQSLTAADYAADLAAKQDSIAAGTAAQFWRGDKTWVDLGNTVRALALTGIVFTTSAAITATDSILAALGKLQRQISDLGSNKLDASSFTFANLGSKPTTLSGYGITDAATAGHTHSYLPLGGGTLTGGLGVNNGSPTFTFQNNAANSAFLHCASNILYVLRGANNATSWTQVNGQWPFQFNLTNNDALCGGVFRAVGDVVGSYSDERLKENIRPIEGALEGLKQLDGIRYTANALAGSFGYDTSRPELGLKARQVQRLFPEAATLAPFDLDEDGGSKSGENFLTLKYERLVPVLIEAIKELDAKVEAMRNGSA